VVLRIGEATLSAWRQLGTPSTDQEGLAVALKGSLADVVPLIRLTPGLDRLDAVAGRVDLVMRASGVLAAPAVNGTVSLVGASFGYADFPRAENVAVHATFDEGLLTLGDVRALWQDATITVTGAVPVTLLGDRLPDGYRQTLPALPDRARLSVALNSVTPAVLAPFVDPQTLGQIAGNFASTATIEATSLELDRLRADITFDRAGLTMGGVPLSQVRPTHLRLASGRLEILDWIWSGGGNQLNARGHVQLDADRPQLDVSLDGSLDLRMLGALSRDITASGRATFSARATGLSSEPSIDGQIVLREGGLAIRDPRIAVTGLTGTVALTASRLQLMDVRASINGGTLQMSGDVQYPGFSLTGGSINLSGRGPALEVPAGLRSEVDADLTFAVSEKAPVLIGRVTVVRGSYRRPISLVGRLLSQVEVESVTPVEPGLLDRIRLSISVVSADGILIDNNYGCLEIQSGLKVTGTPAQTALAGRLTIGEGGAVFLAGQTWRVERGTVDFTSATRIEPNLDLALVTRVQRYDVRPVRAIELRTTLGNNDARVSVTSLIDTEQAQVHLTLNVDEGRQQILQAVAATGAAITTSGTIDRALDLTLGEPADLRDAYRAQKRLYDTGVFQRAEITLEPIGSEATSGPQPVRAAVTLEEVPAYRFRYGIRLGDQTGPTDVGRELRPGLVVDLLRRNLFGRAVSAGLASQVETDRRLLRGILSTPQFFGVPVTSSLFLTRSRQDLPSDGQTPVVEDALDVTLEQRFRPLASMAVSYNYQFKRAHVFRPTAEGSVLSGFDVQVDVARLTGTWAWDTRDDPFDAHTGWFHSSGVEYAAAAMGSDLRFVKYVLQQYYFKPVAPDVVLASAFRLGTARAFAQDLIPSEKFFVGGATSVHGFAEDGLGDTSSFGEPLGGNGSLTFNQEIRFPVYGWVRGVGFVDAGNVFSHVSQMSLFDLQLGTGVGLRINTPFGLARIDFGMPLTSRSREPFGRWYFSLGQIF
jgi:outer membrane translocation and assembly module TamA